MQKYQLDWKMRVVFWLMGRMPTITESNYAQMRAGSQRNPMGFLFRRFGNVSIENRSIPGRGGEIPVRIYHPAQTGPLPVIAFFHGGGFVLCGLESHDPICRRLAVENRAVVVSVDYRLAPEYKHPAAVEDAYDATCWVAQNAAELGGDADRLIVMGDSAGGNLAAVVSLMARDKGAPRVAFQVLIYPAVDLRGGYPSHERYGDSPMLDSQAMAFYQSAYMRQPDDAHDPYASPLLAEDFKNLPPALILTAEYDPLHDEGHLYAERLAQSVVKVTCTSFARMPHGFLSFGRLANQTDAAFARIKEALQPFSESQIP